MQLYQSASSTQKTQVETVGAGSVERRKAYATQLIKTALRYADDEEVSEITAAVEQQIGAMLAARFNPGLNDVGYEVYRKFWLNGGAK
ncbi:hypothetical protein [Pseudomonas sp. NPDC012596]|uniref:hypothetical protein n=1 Tax=Pseudomonas sp. NPDC012596 TaxID=3364419 RepID=UPI0036768D5E